MDYSPEPEAFAPHSFPPDSRPIDVLAILWDKFYGWEYGESLGVLQGLKAPLEEQPPSDNLEEDGRDRRHPPDSSYGPLGDASEQFEFIDYDVLGSEPFTTTIIVESAPAKHRGWNPNPPYTTCTPLGSNVYNLTDTYSTVLHSRYAFFSDDPAFDLDGILKLSERFAWQVDFKDPDREMIKLETVRLLHFQQGLTLQEIDDLRLPSFSTILEQDGLVWDASQRDFLSWPESQLSMWPRLDLGYVRAHRVDFPTDIFSQVQLASRSFCPNFDCLASRFPRCEHHKVPEIRELKPSIATTAFPEEEPCGTSCFRNIIYDMDDGYAPEYLYWTDKDDLDMLESYLKLAPDALPCHLAVICRKPCEQIYANRRKLYPDEDILDNQYTDLPSKFDIRLPHEYVDAVRESDEVHVPISPCSHRGPCRRGACSCYDRNYHCERNCRCSTDCKHRWKGCDCSRLGEKKLCSTISCSCKEAFRECDPELCRGCDAREAGTVRKSKKCWNNDIQQGRSQRIKVSPSQWGYGAYAIEKIPARKFLGDYLGEITSSSPHETVLKLEDRVRKFRGLNYAFGLYDGAMIDSKEAGNETRFLNHGKKTAANCFADVITVNGAHHIVLTTLRSIREGEELLLDYGDKFWNDEDDEESSDSENGAEGSSM